MRKRIESPLLNTARAHLKTLKEGGIIGAVGEIDTFIDSGRYIYKVYFIVGPKKPISPEDRAGLEEFRKTLGLTGFGPIHPSSPFDQAPIGHLRLGQWSYEEAISGMRRVTEVSTLIIDDKRINQGLMAAGVALIKETTKKLETPYRLVSIRPYPNSRLADLVNRYEEGYLSGSVQPLSEYTP